MTIREPYGNVLLTSRMSFVTLLCDHRITNIERPPEVTLGTLLYDQQRTVWERSVDVPNVLFVTLLCDHRITSMERPPEVTLGTLLYDQQGTVWERSVNVPNVLFVTFVM